ncbi:MAG: hypothetical protein ABSA39_04030 [Edaphobacter sp.]
MKFTPLRLSFHTNSTRRWKSARTTACPRNSKLSPIHVANV